MSTVAIVALIIATIIPLITLFYIYSRDLYGTGAFGLIVLCFFWGGFAFFIAAPANNYFIGLEFLTWEIVVRFVAPALEETLKGLVLIYLVRRPQFTYVVDGAIYGFAAGIGFAVIENWDYVLSNLDQALMVALGRVISTNLVHGTGSAIVGIGFGWARFSKGAGRVGRVLAALPIAMALHIGFNNLVTRNESGLLIVYAAVVGIVGVGIIILAIRRGIADQKVWIEEELGMADRVTDGEAAIVHQISDVDKILEPLALRFGNEKAEEIEKFLFMQAQLGIKRKTLEKLQDEKLIEATKIEMAQIREKMDESRRAVGQYTMMYLRSIFPEDDSPLWGNLENVITDRIKSHLTPEGGSLWDKLQEEVKPAKPSDG